MSFFVFLPWSLDWSLGWSLSWSATGGMALADPQFAAISHDHHEEIIPWQPLTALPALCAVKPQMWGPFQYEYNVLPVYLFPMLLKTKSYHGHNFVIIAYSSGHNHDDMPAFFRARWLTEAADMFKACDVTTRQCQLLVSACAFYSLSINIYSQYCWMYTKQMHN